jgi:hypothetical protein
MNGNCALDIYNEPETDLGIHNPSAIANYFIDAAEKLSLNNKDTLHLTPLLLEKMVVLADRLYRHLYGISLIDEYEIKDEFGSHFPNLRKYLLFYEPNEVISDCIASNISPVENFLLKKKSKDNCFKAVLGANELNVLHFVFLYIVKNPDLDWLNLDEYMDCYVYKLLGAIRGLSVDGK